MRRGTILLCVLTTCTAVLGGQTPPQSAGAAPPQTQIRKGTGFLLGRTLDVTGQPVAGALVTLTGYGDLPGGVPGGPLAAAPVTSAQLTASPPRSVITNGEGYFFFRELGRGRYSLAVSAMGYLNGGYLQNRPNGTVHFLDLGENEQRADVVIRLWKYASLSGTVLDEAGEPAVGATVRILQRSFSLGRVRLSPVGSGATADDRGIYRVSGLPPGDYIAGIITTQSTIPAALADAYADAVAQAVDPARPPPMRDELFNNGIASPSGTGVRIGDLILQMTGTSRLGYTPPQPSDDGRMLSYPTTFFQNAPTSPEAMSITLGSGEERAGVDFSIKLVPAVRVSGRLTGPDGPVRNMGVSLVPRGSEQFVSDTIIAAATAATDAGGAFAFLGVPPGSYTLKAMRSMVIRSGPSAADRMLWAEQPITVDSTDVTSVSVALRPGLTLSGRVEFNGATPSPAAQQLQRINVMAVSVLSLNSQRPATAIVRADGTFTTNGDLPGKYFVVATEPPGWTLQSVKLAGRNVTDDPIELTSDVTDLVATFIDRPSKVSGTITDAKGAPETQADVIVFPSDSESWTRGETYRRIRRVSATKSGTYELSLPAGAYSVVAVDNTTTTQWSDPAFLKKLISGATRVTIREGESPTVALRTFAVK